MEDETLKRGPGRPKVDRTPLDPDSILAVSPGVTGDAPSLAPAPDADTNPEAYAAYVAELRQKRKPFGAQMQKLAYPQRSGYKRHWFNDVGGRVQEYMDGGWTQVIDPKGKPVSRTVGTSRDNSPLRAVLLEIPSLFWEEVEAERAAIARARMDDIKSAPIRAESGTSKASDKDKFYSPRENVISVKETLSRG